MAPILFILLIVLPIAELWMIIEVGQVIGVLPTIALLIGISIAGAYLLKREGTAAWKRLRVALQEGRVPTKEATDGALILVGGSLLLTPGFLTDIVGLALILPPSRGAVKLAVRKMLAGWALKRHPAGYAGSKVYRATVTRSRRSANQGAEGTDRTGSEVTPPPALTPPDGPTEAPRSREDDSPDKA